jgi:hypothetical protein
MCQQEKTSYFFSFGEKAQICHAPRSVSRRTAKGLISPLCVTRPLLFANGNVDVGIMGCDGVWICKWVPLF